MTAHVVLELMKIMQLELETTFVEVSCKASQIGGTTA
jgi:hypothetical protein